MKFLLSKINSQQVFNALFPKDDECIPLPDFPLIQLIQPIQPIQCRRSLRLKLKIQKKIQKK